jgi:hypothetical protein
MLSHPPLADAEAVQRRMGEFIVRLRVRGALSETLLGAFPGLEAKVERGDTVLAGALPDQAAVFGVFAAVEALGLELLEVGGECRAM